VAPGEFSSRKDCCSKSNSVAQGIALTLTSMSREFGVDENQIRYTTLALFLGLCIGASFWGTASDVVGRRLAFNFTLFIAGAFGLAAGGGPNWVRLNQILRR
jgi:MFS family permease